MEEEEGVILIVLILHFSDDSDHQLNVKVMKCR